MIKAEFIKGYCKRSKITEEFFNKHMVALTCKCDYENCKGWAAVSNNKLSIKTHKDLY